MNRIKTERAAHSMTQEELAELLGVASSTVGRWEQGGDISMGSLVAMRSIFGVSIDWLLGLSPIRMPIDQLVISGC